MELPRYDAVAVEVPVAVPHLASFGLVPLPDTAPETSVTVWVCVYVVVPEMSVTVCVWVAGVYAVRVSLTVGLLATAADVPLLVCVVVLVQVPEPVPVTVPVPEAVPVTFAAAVRVEVAV